MLSNYANQKTILEMKINKVLRSIYFTKENKIRILWILLFVLIGIILGEVIITDPIEILLAKLGVDYDNIDLIKRIIRTLWILLTSFIILKFITKKTLTYIGLQYTKNTLVYITLGVSLGLLIQLVSLAFMYIFGWYHIIGLTWDYNSTGTIIFNLVYALVFCIETGILEEIIFRGFIFNLFFKKYNIRIGAIVSSILFGVVHFSGFNHEFHWLLSIISSIAVGLVFVQAYLLYNSLWLPIGLHSGWHFAMRLFGTPGLSSEDALLFVTEVDGPNMLVSTKAGGAGLLELLGVLVVSLLLFYLKYLKSRRAESKSNQTTTIEN